MHSAPAVSYPVGRSRFQGWLVGVMASGGGAVGWLWHTQANPAGWRQGLFATTLLGAGIVATLAWRRSPRGSLRWDGQAWSWTTVDASVSGLLTVHLDFQFCLVLSLRPDRGARLWLWPQRSSAVVLWNALRRAVFARGATGQTQNTSTDADWARR